MDKKKDNKDDNSQTINLIVFGLQTTKEKIRLYLKYFPNNVTDIILKYYGFTPIIDKDLIISAQGKLDRFLECDPEKTQVKIKYLKPLVTPDKHGFHRLESLFCFEKMENQSSSLTYNTRGTFIYNFYFNNKFYYGMMTYSFQLNGMLSEEKLTLDIASSITQLLNLRKDLKKEFKQATSL